MVKLSVISQREVEDTLQDFEKRRYLILSALRAQKNLSTAAFFTKRERSSKVSSTLSGVRFTDCSFMRLSCDKHEYILK